ncbi:hypothetical protein RJT34_20294 [Clitoria ternatea]|uniref:Cyclotide n=1 Tax=Clitoria ternatea TaxID=43366 RepID=A0AAN9ISL0_CLITE
MGILRRKHFTLLFLFTFFIPPLHPFTLASTAETTTLLYKGCSKQKLQDPKFPSRLDKLYGDSSEGPVQRLLPSVRGCWVPVGSSNPIVIQGLWVPEG